MIHGLRRWARKGDEGGYCNSNAGKKTKYTARGKLQPSTAPESEPGPPVAGPTLIVGSVAIISAKMSSTGFGTVLS